MHDVDDVKLRDILLEGRRRGGPLGSAPFRRAAHAGFGTLLVIVMALLLCLIVMGIGHGYFSSFTSDQTQKNLMGDTAFDLAENALESAHYHIGVAANDPSAGAPDLFRRFRDELGDFSVDLPVATLPGMAAELDRPELKNFAVVGDAVRLEVMFQRPASVKLPTQYDRFGTLRLTARAEFRPKGVVRSVTRTYDFRISFVSTPRPFDRATVYFHDPKSFLSAFAYKGDPNEYIPFAHEKIAGFRKATEDLRRAYDEEFLRKIEGKPRAGPTVQILKQVIAEMDDLLNNRWPPEVTVEPAGTATKDRENTLHLLPPLGTFALWTKASTVDLGRLNAPASLKLRTAVLEVREPEQLEANDDIKTFLDKAPAGFRPLIPLQHRWNVLVHEIVWTYHRILIDDYKWLQDHLNELPQPAYDSFKPHADAIHPDDLANRSSIVAVEGDCYRLGDDRDINRKYVDLLTRGPACSSVLFVLNTTQELVVDRVFSGRLVTVVTDDVTLRKVAVEDQDRDTVTFVDFGRMAVEGKVQASLVVGGTLMMEPETEITGNLYVREFLMDGSVPPDRILTGTLIRDDRLVGGPASADGTRSTVNPDYQYLTLGPDPVFVTIDRR